MVGLIVLALAATMQEDAAFDRMLRAVERRHAERPDPSDVAAVARSLGFDR
jgi:hypothetical protein